MFVQSISNVTGKQNIKFDARPVKISKLLNRSRFEKDINKINQNEETKNLFNGLTALAGAVIAEVTLLSEQNDNIKSLIKKVISDIGFNDEQENTEDFDANMIIKNKPERAVYLKITSYFPNLDKKYKQMLVKQIDNPEDKKNKSALNTFEKTLAYLSEDKERFMNSKKYLQLLDGLSDNLDDIIMNISSTRKNNQSIMYYLTLLNNGKLTEDDIKLWAKVYNLGCDDFMLVKNYLNENQLENIHNLKSKYPNFMIKDFSNLQSESGIQDFVYKLEFSRNTSVAEKLKIVSQFHEAIYGDIRIKDSYDRYFDYLSKDVKSEMMDNLLKDRRIDAVYNFVKYIEPDSLKGFNLTNRELKLLDKDGETYKKIRDICTHQIMNMDETNLRVQEIYDILDEDEMFGGIINSRHAKIRFITRFALKDNPKADIGNITRKKMKLLIKALNEQMNICNYFSYNKADKRAPQFYVREPNLGNYIKITLNNFGHIHTIFEDFYKEIKDNADIKKESD